MAATAPTTTAEECPLCCELMSPADLQYPLHCATPSCHFQFCFACLQQLAKSAADGYTEASDGSNQVKVALQCPQCRGEYSNRQADPFLTTTNVVHAVLRLRQAASTPLPGTVSDSQLTATQLSHRVLFLEEVGNVKILQDSLKLVQQYHDSLRPHKYLVGSSVLPELDWKAWRPHLEEAAHHHQQQNQHHPYGSTMISSSDSADSAELVLPRDPTLFLGLEDCMTLDEQEFVTRMLVSGNAETVHHAANLLQNMTQVSMGQRSATAVQQLAFSGSGTTTTSTTTNNNNTHRSSPRPRLSKAQLEHQQRVRNRFPLPIHMPRSVTLPVYDPVHDKKPLLEFVAMQPQYLENQKQQHNQLHTPELTLAAVRGPAGRVGLRKGDVVTHVLGEAVSTVGEFVVAIQLGNNSDDGTFQLTVNANETTALALRSRAQDMKLQKIRFHG